MKREDPIAEPVVIVEKEGAILIVTLNRPEKRNAINSEVMCRLYDAWTQETPSTPRSCAVSTMPGPN